ncbi:hypothetical protein G647_07552 [Cladophialophora carrionii CBS 160.54]|uniref:Uncharacterized protein n=1 Tax=Cladophialophora carrionii CBS 160.54 TaxID=1279043 RepID=V9D5C8_9EURO|nr:uncharacterized protein G647_07552 [Cladophialophora carrionii CBS 160.54]ETI21207.1 hypothetical protein G647_07552 [Cladophialophora carrionii CBS 160.54]
MTERTERRQRLKTGHVTNADTYLMDRGDAVPSRSGQHRRHFVAPDKSPHVSIDASSFNDSSPTDAGASSSKSSTYTPTPTVSRDGDHSGVAASGSPRKIRSKAEPDAGSGQAEENARVRTISEPTLTTTGRIIRILPAPMDKLVTSHLLANVMLFLILLGMVWSVLRQVSNVGATVIDVAARGWSLLEATFVVAFDIAIRAVAAVAGLPVVGGRWVFDPAGARDLLRRATESAPGAGALCASPTTLWIATWLRIRCVPLHMQAVSGTLNEMTLELEGWTEISGSLLPYVYSFELANMPLLEKQAQLRWSNVALPAKDALVETIERYVQGLADSANCMFDIIIGTDSMLMVLFHTLKDTQVMVHELPVLPRHWWSTGTAQQYIRVEKILYPLIDAFDKQIAQDAGATSSCFATLKRTYALGLECEVLATQFRKFVDAMLEARYTFPFPSFFRKTHRNPTVLSRYDQGFVQHDLKTIVERLAHARNQLNNHRARLAETRTLISDSHASTNATGMQQLREVIDEVLSRLVTAKQRHASSTARAKAE